MCVPTTLLSSSATVTADALVCLACALTSLQKGEGIDSVVEDICLNAPVAVYKVTGH
jgi:hypothetical protein